MKKQIKRMFGTGEWKRTVLWIAWLLNTLFNLIYVIMSFITCSKLVDSVGGISESILNTEGSHATWRAPIAASSLGPCMVILFNVLSCFILIRKSINRSGPGFGYGVIVAWCFIMSFYCLLCGLILESFSDVFAAYVDSQASFTSYSAAAYDATFYFAYFNAAFFLVFFLCLVVFQGGISKQIGMYDEGSDEKRVKERAAISIGMQLAAQVPPPATGPGITPPIGQTVGQQI